MKETIKKIFDESMAIRSFTNTVLERDIEDYLYQYISHIPYFQEHSDYFGMYEIKGDFHQRRVNWALVNNAVEDTVILFHHHDTVDVEDYGNLKDYSLENEALKEKLKKSEVKDEVLDNINSGEWIFGRGSCDMKSALALQLGVVEKFSQKQGQKVNVLYLSVADEESYSQGMRAAVELLYDLKEKFHLNYILAVDSEPFESDKEQEKGLHIGTVGKLMPVVVTQGVLSHMKEPLKGMNAISLLAKITSKIDLNPSLSEKVHAEQSPLPSWSYMRDLKEAYDVSTALKAAGYFSVLHLERSPKEIMKIIRCLCEQAVDEFYDNYFELQNFFGEEHSIAKPKVLFYEELLQLCAEKKGFENFVLKMNDRAREDLKKGKSYQDITIDNVQKVLEFYDKKDAIVVLAIAPPYYPSMNCRNLEGSAVSIEKVIEVYRDFLKSNYDYTLRVEEFFMGICDISYCALEREPKEYEAVIESMAVPKDLYHIDFEKLKTINVPGINLGPWGKDLHKLTERVFEKDMLDTVPEFLMYLLEHIDFIKR